MTWTSSTLRAAAEVALGRQRSPQHAEGPHMVRYLRAANVKDGVLDLGDVMSMNFTPEEQRIFSLRSGDVLVTEGSGSLASVGASAVWRGELDGMVCFQNTLLRMRPRPDIADGRFLEWWARSAFGSGLFASIATGANIYHLSAERVRSLSLKLPSLEEQRRIADFLDVEAGRIDRLIALRRDQLSLLNERYQSYLSRSASKLMDEYGSVRLRHVVSSIEQGWSPQCEDRLAEEGEWGVVKAGCINGGVFNADQHKALPAEMVPRLEYRLKMGDLLMSRASGSVDLIGSTGVVPELDRDLLLCDKVYRLRVDRSRARETFLAQMLRTRAVRDHIELGISGADGMANNLPTAVVKNCVIPDVPLTVQDALVDELESHQNVGRRARTALKRQLDLLVERKRALVTAAVTGQIDVTARGVEV